MIKLFSSLPHVLYFGKLACYAQNLWLIINSKSEEISKRNDKVTIKDYNKIATLLDESKQLLLYIDDTIKSIPELGNVFLL